MPIVTLRELFVAVNIQRFHTGSGVILSQHNTNVRDERQKKKNTVSLQQSELLRLSGYLPKLHSLCVSPNNAALLCHSGGSVTQRGLPRMPCLLTISCSIKVSVCVCVCVSLTLAVSQCVRVHSCVFYRYITFFLITLIKHSDN